MSFIDWNTALLTIANSFCNGLGMGAGLGLGAFLISKLLIDKVSMVINKLYNRGDKENENKKN